MDIANISQQQFQTLMTGAAQQAAGTQAGLSGRTISLASPSSLVADAAEEASFAMSEREEAKLHERKLMPKIFSKERVEQVEKYLELMEKQHKSKAVDAFISELSASGARTPDGAVRLALSHFEDSADAFAALFAAKNELSKTFDPGFFNEALSLLDDDLGRDITSGQAAGSAALDHDGLGEPEDLKALYAGLSDEKTTPATTYDRILKNYGASQVQEALSFLFRSLGNEMAATTSSTDKVVLESLTRDLGAVQQLHGLYAGCSALSSRLETTFGKPVMNASDLMKEVLSLGRSKFLGGFDIENLAGKAGISEIKDQILFYQEFSIMGRQLSENLFSDPDTRLNIINATQQALDDAIAVEEEMYD